MKVIAKAISELPKKNSQRKRVVVITQGPEPTVLAIGRRIDAFQIVIFFFFSWRRSNRISRENTLGHYRY